MRYRDLPTFEGGYIRTGSRTPMQWDADEVNLGFSAAAPADCYLPVDPAPDAPDVAHAMADPDSLWRWCSIVTLFETPCFANDVNTRYRA